MAHTYTQIYIHYVFATHRRLRAFDQDRQKELYDYIAGIIRSMQCFVQCIGGMEDHVHILIGMHPSVSISDCAGKIKANSTRFVNEKGWALGKFSWQEGYGAFSVSQSNLEAVRAYIKDQRNHHLGKDFIEEYEALLRRHNVAHDQKYIFVEVED